MSSPKSKPALERLGRDVRGARLRRGMAIVDLAVRAGVSPSTLARLEKGEAGVALGALADVLVVLGLVERLADLIDIRSDDLGLALTEEHLPKRGRSISTRLRKAASTDRKVEDGKKDVLDPDGAAF
ncbi:helix-turn-helix domain-containing protein [Brevundimonas sp.]|uniref:helix-turn-helix domain-containing protein n=1 Tax=Brevundimonas sp. TaxID=1871086 RepID=UPI002896FEFC|nr:helix-turn-helix domain-containing protein [Brevundimonas sp.]